MQIFIHFVFVLIIAFKNYYDQTNLYYFKQIIIHLLFSFLFPISHPFDQNVLYFCLQSPTHF